jgi:competence protein ComEC
VRGDVPGEVEEAWRDSGLAHILSISGLHVSLAAGLVFFVVRGLLALVPAVALRWPIKKLAAAAALASAVGYLVLSGADTPTQRAVLMAGLALVGVMLDRPAISMRAIAWAGLVILLIRPESLSQVGFQMSFAAVAVLVAGYEALEGPFGRWREAWPGWGGRALRYLTGIALSTVLAGLATLPFGVNQFNRTVNYSLLANLIGVPLTGAVIMPAGLVALLALPFGLEAWPLAVMAAGIAAVDDVAHAVAGLPGAVSVVQALPPTAFGLMVAGLAWLVVWQRRWRLLGMVPIALGFILAARVEPPDLLVDGQARTVLVRDPSGAGAWLRGSARGLVAETWLRRAGLEGADPFPEGSDGALACDAAGCLWRPLGAGTIVALAWTPAALIEDCAEADVLVSLEPIRMRCPGPSVRIDRFDLWRSGTHALWLRPDGIRIVTVADERGERPWAPTRKSFRNQYDEAEN